MKCYFYIIVFVALIWANTLIGKNISVESLTKLDIERILIFYLPQGLNVPKSINCGEAYKRLPNKWRDTLVIDTKFIEVLERQISSLKELDNNDIKYIDSRIECWIKYKAKEKIDTLCLGEYWGICYNGMYMKRDTILESLIKTLVWDTRETYEDTYKELSDMLEGLFPFNFKRAVFITENAYWENRVNYHDYIKILNSYINFCKERIDLDSLLYDRPDQSQVAYNASVFRFMTDTTFFRLNDSTFL